MAKDFFTGAEQELIVEAIRKAEKNTSGEIRLHVESQCPGKDPLKRARWWFEQLKMHETTQRNGMLFYLATADHLLAIVGDQGIHDQVGGNFWNEERDLMIEGFRQGKGIESLCEAIRRAGEKLKVFYPYQKNDENELDDQISFGNDQPS